MGARHPAQDTASPAPAKPRSARSEAAARRAARCGATLWDTATDAALAAIPAEQVDWLRRAWAVHRMPTAHIAEVLGADIGQVEAAVRHGRPGGAPSGTVYDAMPWPADVLAAVLELEASGLDTSAARGGQVATAKLAPEDVEVIKAAYALGASARGLAQRFGLHHQTVQDIVRGKSWRHVTRLVEPMEPGQSSDVADDDVAPYQLSGGLERLGPGGEVLAEYPTMRAAELASGWPRERIAADALAGRGWRYQAAAYTAADGAEPPVWCDASETEQLFEQMAKKVEKRELFRAK